MQLLNDAIERIKPYLVESLERENPHDRDFNYQGQENYDYFIGAAPPASVARLRLDWELAIPKPSEEALTSTDIVYLMTEFLKTDLEELIQNGDVDNSSDPLLKTIDGSKKRGKEPIAIDIFGAHLFWETKPRKGTTEYALYILMYVDFGD